MKRYWRCFVCNDVHYGVNPPEVCPTCKVRQAYVEITPREARLVGLSSDAPDTPERFRRAIEAFAEKNEFMVNPDRERVDTLLSGLFSNETNHGLKYCPCRLITKDPAEDLKLVCPCHFIVHETYKGQERGECWCGLFIRRDKRG